MVSFKTSRKGRVLCALSGGVDSSVAAALLKQQGYAVFGIFMKFWQPRREKSEDFENHCCSYEASQAARGVAQRLAIPFYTLNCQQVFKKTVVDNFLRCYARGLTPNPCVICNEKVKFGLLLRKAQELGIHYMATGHYAQAKERAGQFRLCRGTDRQKDQSYFLYRLHRAWLPRILFPVGVYSKSQVRTMARRLKLPTAHRPESQEICFVPDDVLSAFFKKYSARCLRPGPIVTTRGQKIGEHQGLLLYTLGQRKGVWAGGGGPYYVLKKDLRNNTLMVTSDRTDLLASGCCLRDFNWLVEPKTNPRSLVAQVRYRAPAVDAQVAGCGTRVHLRFRRPQWAVTAGQSAVLYVGERVVGGGIVDKVSSE